MHLIGFHGKAGCGKDTAFKLLKGFTAKPDAGFHQMAFARGVKLMASKVFQVPLEKFYHNKDDISPRYGKTYRELLKIFGTDFARNMIDHNFWVHYLEHEYLNLVDVDSDQIIGICDVRFENEANWIRDNDGIIIQVKSKVVRVEESDHESEAELPSSLIDYIVHNDGTLFQFRNNLDLILNPF